MKVVLAALPLLLSTGCYTVDIHAPKGAEVVLLPASAKVETTRQWRTWFAAFGLVAMDDTMPPELLQRERLAETRVVVVDTVPDALIGILYNVLFPIGLGVQSMRIEGRAAAKDR